jgi:hypothetical protein
MRTRGAWTLSIEITSRPSMLTLRKDNSSYKPPAPMRSSKLQWKQPFTRLRWRNKKDAEAEDNVKLNKRVRGKECAQERESAQEEEKMRF